MTSTPCGKEYTMLDLACKIRDRDGKVIQQSRNLRGIRRYVGGMTPPIIKLLDVTRVGKHEGKLCILFENGCSFETNFASFSVLCDFVSRWRNVQGAPLSVNGERMGLVESKFFRVFE